MADLYCITCGTLKIDSPTGYFDRETGKPAIKKICPTGKCYHDGIHHKWNNRCTNCGEFPKEI